MREWAIPGMKNLQHRVGGLEKDFKSGNVSYDPANHERMVKVRQEKVDRIADLVPPQKIEQGGDQGKVLVIGWGSTYGASRTAVRELISEGYEVSQAHIKYLNPFPSNLFEVMKNFDKVLIPEINNGQLINLINAKYDLRAVPLNKIKGMPFTSREIKEKVLELLS